MLLKYRDRAVGLIKPINIYITLYSIIHFLLSCLSVLENKIAAGSTLKRLLFPGKLGSRAKCKSCSKDMISLVARMKDHLHKCIGVQQQSASLTSESSDPAMPPEGIVGRMKRTFSQMNTVDN